MMLFLLLSGYVTVSQWSQALEARTSLNLPWRMLSHKLVTVHPGTGKVQWQTTFQDQLPVKRSVRPPLTECVSSVGLSVSCPSVCLTRLVGAGVESVPGEHLVRRPRHPPGTPYILGGTRVDRDIRRRCGLCVGPPQGEGIGEALPTVGGRIKLPKASA